MSRDPLEVLANCRRELLAIKRRDYAERLPTMREQAVTVLDMGTGKPTVLPGRADYNARQRAFHTAHDARPMYAMARERAMRHPLGMAQLSMIEAAVRMDVQCRATLAAFRRAAA